jgi:hypothetical protein
MYKVKAIATWNSSFYSFRFPILTKFHEASLQADDPHESGYVDGERCSGVYG